MPRELKWVSWDDDAELFKSRKSRGNSSPLTRDRDGKLGKVTLSDVDEHELASAATSPTGPVAAGAAGR